MLLSNAAVAFALNMSVYLLIGKTSALTMNVAGVIKDWILIFISSMLFDAPISNIQLGGYLLAFLAVCYYNYAKFKEKEAAAAAGAGTAGGMVKSADAKAETSIHVACKPSDSSTCMFHRWPPPVYAKTFFVFF